MLCHNHLELSTPLASPNVKERQVSPISSSDGDKSNTMIHEKAHTLLKNCHIYIIL